MKRRSDVFTRVGINDIKYYPIDQPPMPRILVVFDEFQVLFEDEGHTGDLRDSDNLSKIKKHLNDILLKGRAYGIHALLVPNNADSIRGIEGFLNYIAVRIALKMPDKGKCLTNDNDVRLDQFEIGEGVYNDNMGAPKDRKGNNRNHFFRSAFYGNLKKEHPSHQEVIVSEMIEPIRKKHVEVYGGETIPKPILFRGGGNSVIADNSSVMTHEDLEKCIVYVGSPITVRRDDVSFIMKPKREYNILIVGANSCYLKSLVQIIFDQIINQSGPHSKCYVCLSKEDDFDLSIYNDKVETHYDKEGLITVLEGLKKHLDDRQKKTESTLDRIVFALMGLRFFTNCIKSDDEVRKNIEEIIVNGPENGIHMLLHATKSMDFQNTFSSNDMFFAPTPFNATPAIPPEELKREFGIKIELRGEDRLFSNQYLDDGPPQDDYLANIQTKERIEITKFSIYKQ
jgi:hypothetical protein